MSRAQEAKTKVKCVVWDLDNTLWNGVLLEDDHVFLKDDAVEIIKTLDSRGILQSIASKNDYDRAMAKLRELGIENYFLYPQINWNTKVASIKSIARSINIGLDTVAFIDDQPFEREEVKFSVPEVLCIDPAGLDRLLDRPEMNPRFITEDSRIRRSLYISDIERKKVEDAFVGPKDAFLATLGMKFTIGPAREEDLKRAEELTVRTHQLNTTGYTYSFEELDQFRQSDRHRLLIAELTDKFGAYGKIGLALVECGKNSWVLKLLLMSCRVMSRGVGTILLHYIMGLAKEACVTLRAEFVSNDRNRMMLVTYKFNNFCEVDRNGDVVIFENDCTVVPGFPDYLDVQVLQ